MHEELTPVSRDHKNMILNHSTFREHALLWIAMGIVAISLIWACVTRIDEITRSDHATVVPTGQTKVIQSLEGGIIKSIFVNEGQSVHKGQVLAEIDDVGAQSQLEKNTIQINALKLRCARLLAEVTNQPFIIPQALKQQYPAQSRSEQMLYETRQHDNEVKIQLLEDERKQLEQEILEQQSEIHQAEQSQALKKKEYAMMLNAQKSGAISPQEILQIERALTELAGQKQQAEHRMQKCIEQKKSLINKKEEVVSSFQKESSSDYNKSKVDLNQLMQEQTSLADKELRTQLRSPVNGIVNKVYIHTEGAVLRSGDTLFDVVPIDDKLVIEAKINPKDIGFIHPGMKANVKITAFDYSLYGGLEGVVQSISPDVLTERDTTYYLVRVVTSRSYLERFGQRYPIIPGMAASVDVLTGKRTVMDYILKPILKARQRAMTER
jgi:adhesin transport system membrane fusion protein